MTEISFFEAQKWAFSFIGKNDYETKNVIQMFLLNLRNWNELQLLQNQRMKLTDSEFSRFKSSLEMYLEDWPPQYIIGHTIFFGHRFEVTEDTLIPRPETEELVEWILKDEANGIRKKKVVDIGTGTGAIGISLKLEQPNWDVTISDISQKALLVAQKNSEALLANVDIVQSDLFAKLKDKYDVIVSNPPYIAYSEISLMDKSVIEHEPKKALFAEEDGLYFYRKIAQELPKYLREDGSLYLEIGFKQGKQVVDLFKGIGQVELKKDFYENDRMVKVVLKKGEKNVNHENL